MTTAEMEVETVVDDVDGVLEDDSVCKYVYPPELIEHWVKLGEEMDLKRARGEVKPMTVEELAAKLGIKMD
jgi:hypothetical protein